jgi:hypothetical protein
MRTIYFQLAMLAAAAWATPVEDDESKELRQLFVDFVAAEGKNY